MTSYLFACGMNHQGADVAMRERFAVPLDQIGERLTQLVKHHSINEAVLLSTCNRTELYGVAQGADSQHDLCCWQQLTDNDQHQPTSMPPSYRYRDEQAINHLMRVASGLDSMVLGETQIFQQLKQAYYLAQQAGTIGSEFTQLFPQAFAVSKQVRDTTDIGKNSLSFAQVTLKMAEQVVGKLHHRRVLLIGAGETNRMMANTLESYKPKRLIIANRSLDRAQQLASRFQATAITLADLSTYLSEVDVIISATRSSVPLITKALLQQHAFAQKHRPLFIADLALPRDVTADVADLEDVFSYNLDDLQRMIDGNRQQRQRAAERAEQTIAQQVKHYLNKRRIAARSGRLITSLREQAYQLRDEVLCAALESYRNGQDAERVIMGLAAELTNKLLHTPTLCLREAAQHGTTGFLGELAKCIDKK